MFYLIIFVANVFYFEYFVKGNERLSHCYKSDGMLCLYVQFENSHLQRFKSKKKKTVAFQIIVCLMNLIEYFDNRKNIRRNIDFVQWRRSVLSPVFRKSKKWKSNIYNVMVITFIITFIHNHSCISKIYYCNLNKQVHLKNRMTLLKWITPFNTKVKNVFFKYLFVLYFWNS